MTRKTGSWVSLGVQVVGKRTSRGLGAAKARGVKFGRRRQLSRQQIDHARKLIQEGHRREDVATLLNVNRTTLYRAIAA